MSYRPAFHQIDIEDIQFRRNATYMGCWPLSIYRADDDEPADIFYIHSAQRVGGKIALKYIAIIKDKNKTYAMVADDIFQRYPIFGVESDSGEVCCSRFPEDVYVSGDSTVFVYGGPTNVITDRPDRIVRVVVQDDKYHFERLGASLLVGSQRSRPKLDDSHS